jgi:undecaprenyl-diphosphatase
VYEAVARTPTGTLDGPVRRLSAAADKSKLWLGIAAVVAVAGGRRGRRAALEGVVAIGVTSATVNLGVKQVARRRRPDRARPALFEDRHVPMPGSTSFPSGHAASAFAFAYAVGRHLPALAVPIRLLAAAVAYSRVHTGIHFPGRRGDRLGHRRRHGRHGRRRGRPGRPLPGGQRSCPVRWSMQTVTASTRASSWPGTTATP